MTPAMTRRLYVIAWLMLGGVAIGYFFTLFQTFMESKAAHSTAAVLTWSMLAKKTAAPAKKTTATAENSTVPGTNTLTPSKTATAEAPAMKADPALSQDLAGMRAEIDRLKASLAGANKETAALKSHIGTLEATFGQSTTASLPAEPTPAELFDDEEEDDEEESITSEQSAPAPKVEIAMLPMPVDGFAINGLPGSPLPIANQSGPTRTVFGVELANGLKPDTVPKRWKWLKLRHDTLLGQLKPRSVTVLSGTQDGKGHMALIAGPFSNAAEAALLCAKLIAAGATCKGTTYAGSPVGAVAAR